MEWETQRSKTVAAPLECPQSCHRHPEESLLTSSQGSVGRESLLEVKCGTVMKDKLECSRRRVSGRADAEVGRE